MKFLQVSLSIKMGNLTIFYSYSSNSWQWDEQAVQSINQRMEGLTINGPAAKVASGKGFSVCAADHTAASSSTY
jgi:hypothetical protein